MAQVAILNYIKRQSPVHELTGTTKLIFFIYFLPTGSLLLTGPPLYYCLSIHIGIFCNTPQTSTTLLK